MQLFVVVALLAALVPPLLVAKVVDEVPGVNKNLDYRKLVEGLVSPNRPVKCSNRKRTFSLPPGYDWKAQERIEENRRLLFDHCDEALPFLIGACTDARYSLTTRWSEDDDFYNYCVGRVCSEIISRHVEAFRKHMRFSVKRWHDYSFVPLPQGAEAGKERRRIEEWWCTRKGMSLRELQLAAFDWAIEKRTGELTELSYREAKKQAEDELKSLRSAREALSRDNKSLPSGTMWRSLVAPPSTHKIVPWSENEK